MRPILIRSVLLFLLLRVNVPADASNPMTAPCAHRDSVLQRDGYTLQVNRERKTTTVTLREADSTRRVEYLSAVVYHDSKNAGRILSRMGHLSGRIDGNATRYGSLRLFPKLYFGNTMMIGDAFAHSATPVLNHYLVAPLGYRYYVGERCFIGIDIAFEGHSYSLADDYKFVASPEADMLSLTRHEHPAGLKRSKLLTRHIALPVSLGILHLSHGRLRAGVELIPQFRYKEQILHQPYGDKRKERTTTHATHPISLTYGAFVDLRPVGIYIHYTPQALLLQASALRNTTTRDSSLWDFP